ncbi:protein LATERAL ORGAN BOUNDARIES-like [Primulina huaijiensis]|uniref:protein LATERAL ORGAN BOUNDARIES-like n=1 Tax=Primulina huaijiensis TaxID=1492673 RepID=UPI003CC74B56
MASSTSYNPPCAACKFLRRKCLPGCMFAPYFPPEEPQKFANVHKIFGASNVTKLLNEVLPHQREDAVNSLAYEAEARVRDPVYGCVGAIAFLQKKVDRLQKELDSANADLIRLACSQNNLPATPQPRTAAPIPRLDVEYNRLRINASDGNGGGLHRIPTSFPYPFPLPRNDSDYNSHGGGIN